MDTDGQMLLSSWSPPAGLTVNMAAGGPRQVGGGVTEAGRGEGVGDRGGMGTSTGDEGLVYCQGERPVADCTSQPPPPTQVLLATGGGHLVYLELTEAGAIEERASVQLGSEVACIDVSVGEHKCESKWCVRVLGGGGRIKRSVHRTCAACHSLPKLFLCSHLSSPPPQSLAAHGPMWRRWAPGT